MNLPLFLARRLNGSRGENAERISQPAVRIATLGVAMGVFVMILSVAVVIGFKKEIRGKVTGFGSDIQLANATVSQGYEQYPVVINDSLRAQISRIPGVKHTQRYSLKAGVMMTDQAFQGVLLKGEAQEFDTAFLSANLVAGSMPQFSDKKASNEVLISQTIADKLRLKVGDRVFTYFMKDDVRARRFKVVGIYNTHFSDFDSQYLFTDLYTLNKLNTWTADQVAGLEIGVSDYQHLYPLTNYLAQQLNGRSDGNNSTYKVQNVEQLNPALFAWLSLLDMNVWVILILMLGISGFTMISGLLIIILERTRMIGVLKALGARNGTIRCTFLYLSVFLVGKGILLGNILALIIYFAQRQWALFSLDANTYYIDHVPMEMNWLIFIVLNVATFLLSMVMLVGPSYLITHIKPVKAIRFE
ncbi:MAG: ABC transporter permease [Bacteroidaceae bacterium]|nr:ABC transporter permease [Bacteroidaceae bacterium]MBP9636853.1 ABC transporter permease [Bacteroidaceae bacterium]